MNVATLSFGIAFSMRFFAFFFCMRGIWHDSLPQAGLAITPRPPLAMPVETCRAGSRVLFVCMVGEGVGLMMFSKAPSVSPAIAAMSFVGPFTHMACGATYALVPFIDRKALGGVAGLIGAGGSVSAVIAGFINKASPSTSQMLWVLGVVVLITATCGCGCWASSC